MMYYVIELQTNADGTSGNIVYAYASKADADEKYHSILASAAKSSVMVHAAVMIDRNGTPLKHDHFVHPVEPQPEEPAEPEAE